MKDRTVYRVVNMLLTALALSVTLLLASCEDIFQPKIPMSPYNDSLGALFRSAEGVIKLDTPTQLYAAPYYSSTEIRVTWNEVHGAEYYMIERAVAVPVSGSNPVRWEDPDEGSYEPLERFVYGKSYVDEILRSPALDAPEYQNKYFYRVSAFNTAKKYDESDPTVPQSAMLFRAPVNVQASGGVSVEYVDLSWEPSLGATSYEIRRSEFPNGASASTLGTVTNVPIDGRISFRNTVSATEQGKDFYYMVTAVNSFGKNTLMTKPAYGYARMFGAPNEPANVRLAENSGRGHSTGAIKIKWEPVDEPEAYYAVYRYSENDSSLTRLTERTETPEWTDTQGLKPGVYYYYRVQAIVDDISSGKSLKSQFSSPERTESFILSSPDEVIAEKIDNSIIIKWRPAKGNESERSQYTYKVYAGSTVDGDYSALVAQGISPNPGADGYISTVPLFSSYSFFKVATVNGSVESNKSAAVSPSPSAAVIQGASQHAFIQNENANSNGVYPVSITWKKPDGDNPAFYHVQRSTRAGSGYAKINSMPLRADGYGSNEFSYNPSTGEYTFIDRNESARVGRKYYYRILSLNQLEQGSFPSDERVGWGALTHTQYLLEYNKTMNAALKKLTYMHKPGSTEKLGTETKSGTINGSIYYNAALDGLGARIIIQLANYQEFYIENVPENGVYFTLSGNSNTSANMSSNGSMDGTVTCTGMYPGRVSYDRIEIKGGDAGGGTYGVQPEGFPRVEVPYTVLK